MKRKSTNFINRTIKKPPAQALVAGILLALALWGVGFIFELLLTPARDSAGVITADTMQPMFEFVRYILNLIAGVILAIAVLQYLVRGTLLKK
ncbi:hypothetical protein [Pseudidiomarina terrestris]|uniref:hypothetical protein n=1 Tax=Pseudidiomarina terrestris TaxID=2820060 RepID=UPI002652F651|nr:hypothetical protein [Pseudidiomarina sp. 1ASP75-5]MDN7134572.1 hypothetical protein [Pseudidiomarina sp. 1ASP75-5]